MSEESEGLSEEPTMVRPRVTLWRWFKALTCTHGWSWRNPGYGSLAWTECSKCGISYTDKCDEEGHSWDRVDIDHKHWFLCGRCGSSRDCGVCVV